MPFRSEAQRRLCYVKQQEDLERGRVPSWNCAMWEKETKTKLPQKLPVKRKSPIKRAPPKRKSPVKRVSPKRKSPVKRVTKTSPLRQVPILTRRTIKSSPTTVCKKGEIVRSAYTRKSKSGKTVEVKAVCIKDQGKPGKGKKAFTIGDDVSLRKFGYTMSDPSIKRHKALQLAVKEYGKTIVRNRLYKLSILFDNKPQLKNILNDIQYLK